MSLPTLAVLAGGLATRLRPVTLTIPKSLVEVAGEPFLAHQLRLARRQGFARVVLLVGHLGEQIQAFAGDGAGFGLEVKYSFDGSGPRGTGGALRNALPLLGDDFFVLYGDSYLDVEARPIWDAYRNSGRAALMSVLHNKGRWDASNVIFDGKDVLLHDKSANGDPRVEWIDYGFSVFSAKSVDQWPEPDPFELSRLTRNLAERRELAGCEVTRRFYEIGKPEGLKETEAYILSRKTGAD